MGCLVLVLGTSLTTCRLDKLIKPSITNRIVVSPENLGDSANAGSTTPRTRTLYVTNADGAALPWRATNTSAWVDLSKSSGVAPDTVVVTLHYDTLSQTLHRDTIVFTSGQAHNTVRVPVAFDILAPVAELVVSLTNGDTSAFRDTSAFLGSAQPDTFSLRINNKGALPLTWAATLNATWVTLSDSGGTLAAQDSTSTVVTLRPDSLNTGPHSGRIIFAAPGAKGSPDTVPITYTIRPCAETAITLDTVVTGSIALSDCAAPQRDTSHAKLYRVQAATGDTLSLRLTAAFDAYLVVTNSSGTALDQNDECPSFVGTACITNFRVPASGQYLIEATTAAAGATGAFTLSAVRERAPSAPQSAGQFRKDSSTAIAVGSVTPQDTVVFKATVNDSNPRDSVRLGIEVAPLGSAFSNSPSHQGSFVAVTPGGRIVAVRASGLSENTGYHWQARTCDKTNRCSPWQAFGLNVETAPDFSVNAIEEDPALDSVSLGQFNGAAAIPVGGGTGGGLGSSQTVTFKALVTDNDPGAVIKLEVEVQPTGTAFNGSTNLYPGAGVISNNTASTSAGYTVPLLAANYHWRAHACDQTGRCSAWVPFGQNAENVTDFHVP
ncbi:MAG TPA: hypothetical protein VGJ83_05110 [Gemmatimonadales bacterium]|jgi:hypothetical protein